MRHRDWIGGRCDRRLFGEYFHQSLGSARGLAQLTPDLRQGTERSCGKHGIEQELSKRSRRHCTGKNITRAEPKHGDDTGKNHEDRKGSKIALAFTEDRAARKASSTEAPNRRVASFSLVNACSVRTETIDSLA